MPIVLARVAGEDAAEAIVVAGLFELDGGAPIQKSAAPLPLGAVESLVGPANYLLWCARLRSYICLCPILDFVNSDLSNKWLIFFGFLVSYLNF